jgi:hypothetical protein
VRASSSHWGVLAIILGVVLAKSATPAYQGSGHGVCQTGCLDRLTWLFVSLAALLFALDGPSSM